MLRVSNISKAFPGVQALDNVNVDFYEGEIHALLGENGAGKSTLIKIMCGILQPDKGGMYLNNEVFKVDNYINALKRDINIVSQEIQVLPGMSVAENIMLGKMITYGMTGILNWRKINEISKHYIEKVELDVQPTAMISTLSMAQKQMIEIAKALSSNAKILLLDEPTSSITENETKKLFDILFELKKRGIIIIFVTHKLEEVFTICDKVTVLRDGKLIGTKSIKEIDMNKVIKMMIGREEKFDLLINDNVDDSNKVLEVRNISRRGKAENASFYLNKGEILGFYGPVGSGRTELVRMIVGLDKKESGDIFIKNIKVEPKSINNSLYNHKIAYITENRKEEGLFLYSSVITNLSVTIWSKIASKFFRFINGKKEVERSKKMVKELDIKITGLNQITNTLSGGNQQKVSIGKWLNIDSDILIFDEPTVGIDIGAREYIHGLIFNLAQKRKKSVILISSDMTEIIKLSDRVIVFNDKKIKGEVRDLNKYNKDYEIISKKIAECLHGINEIL